MKRDILLQVICPLKILRVLIFVFNWLYLICSTLVLPFVTCFTGFWSPLSFLCTVTDAVSYGIGSVKVLSINPQLIYLSFDTFLSTIRTGWPILIELINPMNSVIIVFNLNQIVDFPYQILDCDATVLLFWIFINGLTWVIFSSGLPSIGKFWLWYCLSFHWLSFKLKGESHCQ